MEPAFYRETFVAEDWDWWHVGRRRILARVLDRALSQAGLAPAGLEMLDVGCGTGGTTAFLGRGHRVTGCELDAEAATYSAGRGLQGVVRGSAEALPFRDRSFDVVLCLDVLEHHGDDLAVAREALRVLRPGGLLLVTVPCFGFLWGPHDVLSRHRRRYVLPGLLDVLRRAGFAIRRASYFNSLLFPAVAAVQSARRLMRRGRPAVAASDLPQGGPGPLNAVLREVFAAEGPWVSRHALPFGVSAFAVAQAPAAVGAEAA
jgi:SAM-dependent methyltransferase